MKENDDGHLIERGVLIYAGERESGQGADTWRERVDILWEMGTDTWRMMMDILWRYGC